MRYDIKGDNMIERKEVDDLLEDIVNELDELRLKTYGYSDYGKAD